MKFLDSFRAHFLRKSISGLLLGGFALVSFAQSNLDYTATPPLSQQFANDPMVMLALASDHQLFIRAYNEFDDLDGDGQPDSGYSHNFAYVGYFDNKKCYAYDGGIFSPTATAPTPAGDRDILQYCSGNEWSGNFLNWLTMTRADIVRMVLYGGYRSIDTPEETVLERAYLPSDAHSFAKYYAGDDIEELMGAGDLGAVPNCRGGTRICKGVTFCNTSRPVNGDHFSHDRSSATQPPLLRVVKGNYSLWGSSERYQCLTLPPGSDSPDESERNRVLDAIQDPSVAELQPNGLKTQGVNTEGEQVLGLDIKSRSPLKSDVRDFNVRVRVCGANSAGGVHKCRAYGQSVKPIGVLQEVGGDGTIKFGLMTRGYNTNKSFGVLRKNISSFADEINPDDGTFKVPPLGQLYGNPQAAAAAPESIVGALNALRLVDYRYNYQFYGDWRDTYYRGTYLRQVAGVEFGPPHTSDDNPGTADNRYNFFYPDNAPYDCTWGRTSFVDGECRNWGNPFSELMAEAYRYLAGAPNPTVTDENRLDNNEIPGLRVANWDPPTKAPADGSTANTDLSCVNMNVLAFNASAVSYDGDELDTETTSSLEIGKVADDASIANLTKLIGDAEGITGGLYFVGSTGAEGEHLQEGYQQCTAKVVTSLADVRGTCPDAPRLEGSYLVSGLAHFVKTRDMLEHVPGKNTISTFGVRLAGDLPNIELPDQGITIIPACNNVTDGVNCALVDFRKLEPPENAPPGTDFYFVSWEDSEQGGDYDQDLNGVISVNVNGNIVTVGARVYQISSRKVLNFGYIVSGAKERNGYNPAVQVETEVVPIDENDDGWYDEALHHFYCPGGENCSGQSVWVHEDFELADGEEAIAGDMLKDPLWYATKWGGFKDSNTRDNTIPIPDLDSEWKGADGNPFGYTLVRNPADLSDRLSESIKALVKRPASGSGAAVASNTLTGEGLLLQAAYKPEVVAGDDAVSWVGILNGLFFDSFGNIREDTNGNQRLDSEDDIIEIYYDNDAKDTLVRRMPFHENPANIPSDSIVSGLSLENIKPVWSARDELANLNNTQKSTQRTYSARASTGRHIFTSIDRSGVDTPADGLTTPSEVVDFTASVFDGSNTVDGLGAQNFKLLGVGDGATAGKVVNFIRGVEGIEGFRNRTVDYDGNGRKPWILGDIVHSTPAVVGRPSDGYNVSYSDQTYAAFRNHYLNRRQVAYVGANDGMLHAFNMGVYDEMSNSFTEAGHPLGSELWAYVPYNLLPHLKWLTQPDYSHVYYVDSSVKAYDVNIFASTGAEGRHPYGWGTIIVVGMRFGGGEYEVSVEDGASPRTLRSAYMIFDVTDPEEKPRLIAEITDEEMGYTLMEPELVHFRQGKTSGGFLGGGDLQRNDWYLVFGNGPTNLEKGVSDKPAKLFYLDLKRALQGTTVGLTEKEVTGTGANGHVAALRAVDWNGDYQDDYLYISVVGDGSDGNLGSLRHAPLTPNSVIGTVNPLLMDGLSPVSAPFSVPVLPVRNLESGDFWVFAGTGRLLVSSDLENEEPGAYYGIKVSQGSGTSFETSVDIDDMYPVTGHSLYEKDIYGATMVTGADGVQLGTLETFQEEKINPANNKGWYKEFIRNGESNFVPTSLLRSTLLINSYTPGISDCEPLGTSYLYALNAFNGLPDASLGNLVRNTADTATVGDDTYKKVEEIYGEVDGVAMNVTLTGSGSGLIGTSTSELKGHEYDTQPKPGARRSWKEVPLDVLH